MKKRNIILIILNFIFGLVCTSQVNFLWANSIAGSSTLCAGASIGLDASGNVYSTGYFDGTADFDPSPGVFNMISSGAKDIFICKLNSNGSFVWAKSIGGISSDVGQSIYVDQNGNSYITGYYGGTVDFDPGPGTFTLNSLGQQDIFVLKLDVNGNFVWAKSMGGIADDFSYSIICDGIGNIYTTGYYNGSADFDPGLGTYNLAGGFYDIFVSKLDASGNFVWAKSMGGSNGDSGYSIALDLSGNVYTTGYYQGTADFDPGAGVYNLSSNIGADIFISKLDASGNFVWAKSIDAFGSDRGASITIDLLGNVYTTGWFGGWNDFDPGPGIFTIPSGGALNSFILKLDAGGNFIWAAGFSGTQIGSGISIKTDAFNNVYSTGFYSGTTDFDPGLGTYTITSAGNMDIYVTMLDASGNFIWTKSMGGINDDFGYSLALDAIGNIYSAGFYNGISDFDPGLNTYNLTTPFGQDVYIHKMNQCLTPDPPANATSNSNQTICANTTSTLAAIGSGTINWYSSPGSTISLGTGTNFITPVLSTGTYTYYAESMTCTLSLRIPITVTVVICTELKGITMDNTLLNLYPNPFTDKLNLSWGKYNTNNKNTLIFTDLLGKKIIEYPVPSQNSAFNFSNLPNGTYFVSLFENDKIIYRNKFIKQ